MGLEICPRLLFVVGGVWYGWCLTLGMVVADLFGDDIKPPATSWAQVQAKVIKRGQVMR